MSNGIKPKRKFAAKPTGAILLFLFLLVQMASFTTGENLVYLMSSATMSFIVISLFGTRRTLKHVTIKRTVPESAQRDEPFNSVVRIHNAKRFFPALSIQVQGGDHPESGQRYLGRLPSNDVTMVNLGHVLKSRGVHKLPPVVLCSSFPLGLFTSLLICEDREEVTIYPRIHRLPPRALSQLEGSGDHTRKELGEGDEFFSLRDYIPGDNPRKIVWKVSARVGHLVVREQEPCISRSVYIFFDTRSPAHTNVPDGWNDEALDEQFEMSVDLTASLAVAFLKKRYSVAVVTPDKQIPLGDGKTHTKRIMEMLARVELTPASNEPWPPVTEELHGVSSVVISPDPTRWGTRTGIGNSRVLNPRDIAHA